MKRNIEQSVSLWMATADVPSYPELKQDIKVDVCIVGAGMAGLTTAYLLAKEGRSVAVIDDGPLASGQSQRTTAHLANAIDDRYFEVEKIHGQAGAKLAAESHTAAIDRIEAIAAEEGIDCDFERLDGYLFSADDSTDILTRECEAATRAGLNVELVQHSPLISLTPGPCLRFPRQAQFHPLNYFAGLSRAIERLGGRIYCKTHVKQIKGGPQAHVSTENGHTVAAEAIVVATNTPINDMFAIHTKQAAYLTYAICAAIPTEDVPKALYWDTLDAYHYIRLQDIGDGQSMLIVGGEDHKAGQATDQQERWLHLEAWARQRFPTMGAVDHRWSGIVMETTDGLAFIGRNPSDFENVLIATGDSGMGLTHGTIAGMLLTDLIQQRENPWSGIYDPTRKPVWGMAWKEYLSENANVAKQYAQDWLGAGDVASQSEIEPGTGAILREGLKKVAVFRDEHGTCHRRSAVCPHLGGIVHWNNAEKVWDCPCHGSRFDAYGGVISGPTNAPLPEAD